MEYIKSYKPKNSSINSGQVLHCPYDYKKARLIVAEMTELLSQDLVRKKLVTDQIVLTIGYDVSNLTGKTTNTKYAGEITTDFYGRKIPKHAHGTINIDHKTSSTQIISQKVLELYDRIINKDLLIRRINISVNKVISENDVNEKENFEQLDMFTDYKKLAEEKLKNQIKEKKEKSLNLAILNIKNKYGKNAILKGMNFEDGGTTISRNAQVGGHKE